MKAAIFKATKEKKAVPENLTLREAIDKYIDSCDNLLSPTTIQNYRKIQRNSFSMLMDVRIGSITTEILKEAVNKESKRPSRKSSKHIRPVSAKTVIDAYGFISAVLRQFRPELNTSVKLPAKISKIKEILEPDIIFSIIQNEPTEFKLAVSLAMWLSFTKSEIRGLKRDSIHNGHLQIDQVIVDVDNRPLEKKQAKTFSRTRKHKIPTYIQSLIDQLPPDQEYLVPLSGHQLYKRWVKLLKRNNLPHMTFHDLRHVNASVMALLQIPDKYAMERGGWKTDSTMKGVYTHTFSKARKDVDETIDSYFESQLQGIKSKTDSPKAVLPDLTSDQLKKVQEYANFLKSCTE